MTRGRRTNKQTVPPQFHTRLLLSRLFSHSHRYLIVSNLILSYLTSSFPLILCHKSICSALPSPPHLIMAQWKGLNKLARLTTLASTGACTGVVIILAVLFSSVLFWFALVCSVCSRCMFVCICLSVCVWWCIESWAGCCNDCGICCLTCLFPCIQYGMNAETLDGSSCFGNACCYMLCGACTCCIHGPRRRLLREKYGLQEDCNDYIITCPMCSPCAICQEAREMKARGPPPNQTMGY